MICWISFILTLIKNCRGQSRSWSMSKVYTIPNASRSRRWSHVITIVFVSQDYSERHVTKFFNFGYSSRIWLSRNILFSPWLSILDIFLFPKRRVLSLTVIFKITNQLEVTWCPDTYSSDNSEYRLVDQKDWDDGVLKVSVKKFVVFVKINSKYKLLSVLSSTVHRDQSPMGRTIVK